MANRRHDPAQGGQAHIRAHPDTGSIRQHDLNPATVAGARRLGLAWARQRERQVGRDLGLLASEPKTTGVERRRGWRLEEKLRIVAEAEQPGASFADVARRHEVSRGLLWNWRRQVRRGELAREPTPMFMPLPNCRVYPRSMYPPGDCRLPVLKVAGDLSGAYTSGLKIRGGLQNGDYLALPLAHSEGA